MRRVLLESPYQGEVDLNVLYARRCVRNSVLRGEAPLASHLLYTQAGVLDDNVPKERALGIAAGLAWLYQAEAMVVYTDRGVSVGMRAAIAKATEAGLPIEYRTIGDE